MAARAGMISRPRVKRRRRTKICLTISRRVSCYDQRTSNEFHCFYPSILTKIMISAWESQHRPSGYKRQLDPLSLRRGCMESSAMATWGVWKRRFGESLCIFLQTHAFSKRGGSIGFGIIYDTVTSFIHGEDCGFGLRNG